MEDGSYRKKINFEHFLVRKFVPHLFSFSGVGCGASALVTLTGENPESFRQREDWTGHFMVQHLRKRGFEVEKLTKKSVTNVFYPSYPLTKSHVILMSLKYIKGQATWMILFGNRIYHNFDVLPCTAMELLNHPVIEAFLITHPSWMLRKNYIRLLAQRIC